MAYRIVVQDGNIIYQTSDPAFGVNFGIDGVLNVAGQLNVGDNLSSPGIITSASGQNLTLETGTGGNLNLSPSGALLLNGVSWPTGSLSITPGQFLGASALNTLSFYPFVIATVGSDTLTQTQLNASYPNAQEGQSVIGPTVVYQCVSTSTWRTLGSPGSGSGVSQILAGTNVSVSPIGGTGAVTINGVSGSGGTPTMVVQLQSAATFKNDGTACTWNPTLTGGEGFVYQASTDATWNNTALEINFLTLPAYYKITCQTFAVNTFGPAVGQYFNTNESTYGTDVSAGFPPSSTMNHYLAVATGVAQTTQLSWIDEYVVYASSGTFTTTTVSANTNAVGVNISGTIQYTMIVTVQKITP
jgi:hypothetical protein